MSVAPRMAGTALILGIARGNKLYPLAVAFYLRGEDLKDLRGRVNQLNALLLPNGLQPITQ